ERQRARSGEEKGCGYDHEQTSADLRHHRWFRRLSCQATIPRFSNPRTYQGNAQCNRMHPAGEFFQQTVPRRVPISTIRQILNSLANFEGRIDGHDFFCTYSRLKPDHNVFRQGRQAIPKVDDSPDAVRSFDSAKLFRIHKFREQITGKHRFYEPDWPPVGHLAEAQSRRETLDAKLTPESDGSQMLPLRLRL